MFPMGHGGGKQITDCLNWSTCKWIAMNVSWNTEVHSAFPYPALLIRSPPSTGHFSGNVAMVNMALICTEKHIAWSYAPGRMYMHTHACTLYNNTCTRTLSICVYTMLLWPLWKMTIKNDVLHMHVHVLHVCTSSCILSYGRIRVMGTLRDGGARIRVECTQNKTMVITLFSKIKIMVMITISQTTVVTFFQKNDNN